MSKDEQDKKKDALGNPINDKVIKTKADEAVAGWFGIIVVAIILFYVVSWGYGKFSDSRDDKRKAKDHCARMVEDIKTDFAAKKKYKSCMARKGY